MTYVEGASLHQERAGSTVFARYAFNELVSFVAGWVMLLDYVILLAVTAFTATHYLAAFWAPLGRGALESIVALAIIAWVAWRNDPRLRAARASSGSPRSSSSTSSCSSSSSSLGLSLFFDLDAAHRRRSTSATHADLGGPRSSPSASPRSSSPASSRPRGCPASCASGARGLKRLIASATLTVLVLYVGIAVVALTALPVVGNDTVAGAQLPRRAAASASPRRSRRTGTPTR